MDNRLLTVSACLLEGNWIKARDGNQDLNGENTLQCRFDFDDNLLTTTTSIEGSHNNHIQSSQKVLPNLRQHF